MCQPALPLVCGANTCAEGNVHQRETPADSFIRANEGVLVTVAHVRATTQCTKQQPRMYKHRYVHMHGTARAAARTRTGTTTVDGAPMPPPPTNGRIFIC